MPTETPRRLLEYLAEGLVDEPEEVSVEQFEEDDGTIVLELCVGADDYGRVIGRGGRTAHALRTVVKAAAAGRGLPRARRHRRLTRARRRRSGARRRPWQGRRTALRRGGSGAPHGLDGSFYVTGARAARLLTLGGGVTVAGRTAAIVRRAGTDERPILRLEGIEDRDAAEALRGQPR